MNDDISGAGQADAGAISEGQRSAEERLQAFGVIESEAPGRIRLRLPRSCEARK